MPYNIKRIYKELDQVGVAISVVGTRRQKLMELARLAEPIVDRLVGDRPSVKRLRDDLVRLAHNVRRVPVKAKMASKAVRELAEKVKEVEKLLAKGRGDVPREFSIGGMKLPNAWGYTPKEVTPFLGELESVLDSVDKMGLTREVGRGVIVLDPRESPWSTMDYDPYSDQFFANPVQGRKILEELAQAMGGRVWVQLFKRPEVEAWGVGSRGWNDFAEAFARLVSGKGLSDDEKSKMESSLGGIIGPSRLARMV
jgi:hypothetical protein